jgi:hypothetical protein
VRLPKLCHGLIPLALPALLLPTIAGCPSCNDPYIPSQTTGSGGGGSGGVGGGGGGVVDPTPEPLPPAWPFNYQQVTSDTSRILLFSNFTERLIDKLTAEADPPVAFFRAAIEPGKRYRIVFDHFNATNETISLYLQIQGVAETPDGTLSTVGLVREKVVVTKFEASQVPFTDFLNGTSPITTTDVTHPGLYERKLLGGFPHSALAVGAVDFHVNGSAPAYIVSLVASTKTDDKPNLAGLQFHGYKYLPGMKENDWRRQFMGKLASDEVAADVPLLVKCGTEANEDNVIFHGASPHQPLSLNAPGKPDAGNPGSPLMWGTHGHYILAGKTIPSFWPDRGYVNLNDLLDVFAYRATPPDLEAEYLRPLTSDPIGVKPSDPSNRWLWFPMYKKLEPTTLDPTGGADDTYTGMGQFGNWPNFGVVSTQRVSIKNECHLPRSLHLHLYRPALVDKGSGNVGYWDRTMPCGVLTNNGLSYRVDGGAWKSARLGVCRSDLSSMDDASKYPVEQRAGFLPIADVVIEPNQTANIEYSFMLTPPSTQNLVHVVTLDPLRRVSVPAGKTSYVYSPLAELRRWKQWDEKEMLHVLDTVQYPGLQTGVDEVQYTPNGENKTDLIEYTYHDSGHTEFREAGSNTPTSTTDLFHVIAPNKGRGLIEVKVGPCPAGTSWDINANDCIEPDPGPPPFVGTATPTVNGDVDWAALDSELMANTLPDKLQFGFKTPYEPGNGCGEVEFELPVPCGGSTDYAVWRLGGAAGIVLFPPQIPQYFNDWVHNPGYIAEGMMDPFFTHPDKSAVVACQGLGVGYCSFGSYGSGTSDKAIEPSNLARMDTAMGPLQPGAGAYKGRIRAFDVHTRASPDPSLPPGFDTCFDRIAIHAQGGGVMGTCQNDGQYHGAIYLVFQGKKSAWLN